MLSRKNRFHGYNSLNHTYRLGKTLRGPNLTLRYAANPKRPTYRVAVVVSKKVDKSAVARNRIRRRIYEAVRLNAGLVPGSFDLIFTVYGADFATMPADKLQEMVVKLLSALK
ncbi:ribonuclease P protein component [Candidatus Saccharibacteria bacterium]|nr:ribonuclease P protein component [Candidatus Saccharibacteria bacterium]